MEWLSKQTEGLCNILNFIAGCALTCMMLLTVSDVILRFFKIPIIGAYELVAFGGGLVIGLSLPITTFRKGHILVDDFIKKFSRGVRNAFHLITRILGLVLFSVLGWNMYLMGMDMIRSGEVSLTLQLPFYPVVFGIGVACIVMCLVFIVQIYNVFGGSYE
jgi:TRAP-type C4-dicarboxylate transport system permease small subunit